MKENSLYPVYDYGELNPFISNGNTKMGNIPQFNTLPGNRPLRKKDGRLLTNIVGTCGKHCGECFHDCYAVRFIKCHHNTVVKAYASNTVIMRHNPNKLRKSIKEYCDKNIVKYFRFHTSGELESMEQMKLYCDICKDNQDVVFYIYTKAFDILETWIGKHTFPKNLVVNLSQWNDNLRGVSDKLKHMCNIFAYDDGGVDLSHMKHCPAVDRKGHETGVTCAECRRCMKKGNVTAVYAH